LPVSDEKAGKRRGWFGWGKRRQREEISDEEAPLAAPGTAGHFVEPQIVDEPFEPEPEPAPVAETPAIADYYEPQAVEERGGAEDGREGCGGGRAGTGRGG